MSEIDRRRFIQACLGAGLMSMGADGLAAPGVAPDGPFQPFKRVRLVDAREGTPMRVTDLQVGTDYVFFYPFHATPCLLINLGRPTAQGVELTTEKGEAYRWPGGVGPQRSVVSFSAICAHRMAHPTSQVTFIGYRPDVDRFMAKDRTVHEKASVIHCCSENSVYDPAEGCRVLGGPAPQPLAAIGLDVDADQGLFASGVFGPTQFERFFDAYGPRLELEFGPDQYRRPVEDVATVLPLAEFTRQRVRC